MTVSTTVNKVSYTASAAQTTFAYTFKIFADGDLKVYVNSTQKTLTTDYTVTGAGDVGGGNIVFGTGLSASDSVVIERVLDLTQGMDYVENDAFPAETHEGALDRLTYIEQQQQEELGRAIKFATTITDAGGVELDFNIEARKNKAFIFDSSGDFTLSEDDYNDQLTNVTAQAIAAAVSEANAASSEANAETAWDSFDDIYLGAKASDPSVDNDGNTLLDGAMYYDTTLNITKIYDLGTTTWNRTTPTTAEQATINILGDDIDRGFSSGYTDAALTAVNAEMLAIIVATAPVDQVLYDLITSTVDGYQRGDIDNDGDINISDTVDVLRFITGLEDYEWIRNNILGPMLADMPTYGSYFDSAILTISNDLDKINTVATDITNVNNVALNKANVDTVAGINASITTVAGISANTTTVAGISSNVTTVAGISSDVASVAADSTDIGTVAAKATEIGRLGTADAVSDMNTLAVTAIIDDMDTVAGISSDVTTVADNTTNINSAVSNASNINAVVSNATNINTVAGNDANVTTVAGVSGNVTTVAGVSTNVTTVAGISADVTTVAGVSSDVTTVAGISADVTAVAADATDIGIVSTNIADVSTVATNIADVIKVADDLNEAISEIETAADDLNEAVSEIDTVATAITNVDNVGNNIANVNTVAGIASDVTTTAGNTANINTVAGNNTNITTVAGVSTNVTAVAGSTADMDTCATNIANINLVASNINTGVIDGIFNYGSVADSLSSSTDYGSL